MIDKLALALRTPEDDEKFVKWLSDGIYQGNRTQSVLDRLTRIAREAIQPAILRIISDDFVSELRNRINDATRPPEPPVVVEPAMVATPAFDVAAAGSEPNAAKGIVTTEEELDFHRKVRDVCAKSGESPDCILCRDTVSYFNVSYSTPTKWFVRLFSGNRAKAITTLVPVDEAKKLASGFDVEDAPKAFGISRIYIDTIDQVWGLSAIIVRSLELCKQQKAGAADD
jgi:predicted type IV restriction endonuclease